MVDNTGVSILSDYNILTSNPAFGWYDWIKLLDGFDDNMETCDLTTPQPRLVARLEALRANPDGFKTWRRDCLYPVRNFITAHWFPRRGRSSGRRPSMSGTSAASRSSNSRWSRCTLSASTGRCFP